MTDWCSWFSAPEAIDEKPFIRTIITAHDIDNKRLPDTAFQLEYTKPGTRVHSSEVPGSDKTADGMVYYRVPTNPEHLDEVIRVAAEEQSTEKKTPLYRYVLLGVAVISGGGLCVLLSRRRRQKGAGTESATGSGQA